RVPRIEVERHGERRPRLSQIGAGPGLQIGQTEEVVELTGAESDALVAHQGTPRLIRTTRGEQEATERLAAGLGGRGQAGAALQRGLGFGSISEGMEGAAEEEQCFGVVRRATARGVE